MGGYEVREIFVDTWDCWVVVLWCGQREHVFLWSMELI